MTGPRPAARSVVAASVAATVVILLATACRQPPSAESAALTGVIRGAQTAELNLDSVRAGYQGPGSSPNVMQPVLDHVQTELAKYYVGTLLTRKVTEHQEGIRAMAKSGGGGRIGGVRALDLKDVRVSDQTANAKAEVTLWFTSAQFWYQPVTSRPAATNVIDLDLHLVRDAGGWKIDQEHWQFAPGGGP
jgi:hypothetical protein